METINQNTLKTWVGEFTEDLYSWAFHKTSDAELAQDLVQDTFLAAAEKMDGFLGKSSPKTWLFSILNHKIIDTYRKKVNQPVRLEEQIITRFFSEEDEWKPGKRPLDWHEKETHLLDNIDFQAILNECLESLPEKWNTCVKLKYLMNKDGNEICQELNISPSNFWQIVHRAKLQLKDCLDINWFNN